MHRLKQKYHNFAHQQYIVRACVDTLTLALRTGGNVIHIHSLSPGNHMHAYIHTTCTRDNLVIALRGLYSEAAKHRIVSVVSRVPLTGPAH